jgi:hypothetical protein
LTELSAFSDKVDKEEDHPKIGVPWQLRVELDKTREFILAVSEYLTEVEHRLSVLEAWSHGRH